MEGPSLLDLRWSSCCLEGGWHGLIPTTLLIQSILPWFPAGAEWGAPDHPGAIHGL